MQHQNETVERIKKDKAKKVNEQMWHKNEYLKDKQLWIPEEDILKNRRNQFMLRTQDNFHDPSKLWYQQKIHPSYQQKLIEKVSPKFSEPYLQDKRKNDFINKHIGMAAKNSTTMSPQSNTSAQDDFLSKKTTENMYKQLEERKRNEKILKDNWKKQVKDQKQNQNMFQIKE